MMPTIPKGTIHGGGACPMCWEAANFKLVSLIINRAILPIHRHPALEAIMSGCFDPAVKYDEPNTSYIHGRVTEALETQCQACGAMVNWYGWSMDGAKLVLEKA